MTKTTVAGGAFVAALFLVVLVLVVRDPAVERDGDPVAPAPRASNPEEAPGFLYGRVTVLDGATYAGRLRWGRDQEAFWSDYFNGTKDENPWAVHAPGAPRQEERSRIEIFGLEFGGDRASNLDRPFMAPFGDIARIDASVAEVQVSLKSGMVVVLDRFAAGDIDDGIRVWDGARGIVDLDARRIRTIEFLPTRPLADAPERLHGTVRTRQGDFTGFIQWDRQDGLSIDKLDGRTADAELGLPYDGIRSIARQSSTSARVRLLHGQELVLSDTREVGAGHRGIYVDDARYGRVLISWDAFERIDFSDGGSGPAYDDFAPGRPLVGTVTTADGRRLGGRLVFDFDESETTATLDAPSQGVDYTIPFRLIASILPGGGEGRPAKRARVVLHGGEELQLERAGDLAAENAGMLIFIEGNARPEFVRWADVDQIDLEPAPSGER